MSKVLASPNPPVQLSLARMAALVAAGIAVLSVALYVGATHLGATLRLAGAATDPAPIELRIGRHGLDIPANAIRFPEQRMAQLQGEIDLYLKWPEMTGFSEGLEDVFHDPEAGSLLFLRLSATDARSGEADESASPSNGASGPAGLTRSVRAGLPGIASQEAVYRASAGRDPAYEASCLDGKDAIMAADCIREVQIVPGLRLRYHFSHALLPQWDRIDRAVLAYLAQHRRS